MENTPAISSGALSHSRSVRSVAMPVLCLRARQSRGSKYTTEDDVRQKACSVTGRSNRSVRATYQKSPMFGRSPRCESHSQCCAWSTYRPRTAGKPRVSRASRRVRGGGGGPSPGRATRGRSLSGTMARWQSAARSLEMLRVCGARVRNGPKIPRSWKYRIIGHQRSLIMGQRSCTK